MDKGSRKSESKDKIREAFRELVTEVPLRKITVTALARRAHLNRKTFYVHYEALDDLLDEVNHDCVTEVEEKLATLDSSDLSGGIYVYFSYLDTDDEVLHTLLFGDDYRFFLRKFAYDVMNLPFFMNFCRNDEYHDLMPGYFESVTGSFLKWKDTPDAVTDLRLLAEKTGRLLYNGLSSL